MNTSPCIIHYSLYKELLYEPINSPVASQIPSQVYGVWTLDNGHMHMAYFASMNYGDQISSVNVNVAALSALIFAFIRSQRCALALIVDLLLFS